MPVLNFQGILWLGLAGLVGLYARYGLSFVKLPWSQFYWIETLIVNSVGSFLAGVLFILASQKGYFSESTAVILLVGFCGCFTTFSAYSQQNFQLIQNGLYAQALFNLLFAPFIGIAFLGLGTFLGKFF